MKKKRIAAVGKVPEDQWIRQVQDGLQRLANCIPSLPNPTQISSTSAPSIVKSPKLSSMEQRSIQPTSSCSAQMIPNSSKSEKENVNVTVYDSIPPKSNHKSNGESEKKEKTLDRKHTMPKKLSLKEKLKKNPLLRFKM